jgi:restriction system protein
MKMPWPVGVGFAAVVFVLFQLYQLFFSTDSQSPVLASLLPVLAYGFCALLLFAAFLSFIAQIIRSRQFKATQSIADIRSLSWRQFETYAAEMFREQGYFVVETLEGPDNGVDLVLRKDGEKTYVQCKHWKANSVGVEKVRELLGAMTAGGAQNGIFVASGNYTRAAEEFAREAGVRLIGGEELAARFSEQSVRRVQPGLEGGQAMDVRCPVCQSAMVKRIAKRGARQGQAFLGCSRYPQCKGTRDL